MAHKIHPSHNWHDRTGYFKFCTQCDHIMGATNGDYQLFPAAEKPCTENSTKLIIQMPAAMDGN